MAIGPRAISMGSCRAEPLNKIHYHGKPTTHVADDEFGPRAGSGHACHAYLLVIPYQSLLNLKLIIQSEDKTTLVM